MTLTEALNAATDALNNAVTKVLGVYGDLSARLDQKVTQVQTIIYNFDNRSAYNVVYVDEIAGNDANDGTIDAPKRNLDTVIEKMGLAATEVRLLSDVTWRRKLALNASLILSGVQKSGAAPGFTARTRQITVQGVADNSPIPGIGTFCAGTLCYASLVSLSSVIVALQDVPNGYSYRSVFSVQNLTSFVMSDSTLTVSSAQAGSLFSSILGKVTASLSIVLGAGAAGHIFDGIAAGANPNTAWKYSTNITSA